MARLHREKLNVATGLCGHPSGTEAVGQRLAIIAEVMAEALAIRCASRMSPPRLIVGQSLGRWVVRPIGLGYITAGDALLGDLILGIIHKLYLGTIPKCRR